MGWSLRKVIRRASQFRSDLRITVESDAGEVDLLYAEEDGEVTPPWLEIAKLRTLTKEEPGPNESGTAVIHIFLLSRRHFELHVESERRYAF